MDFKNIWIAFFHGFCDSFHGIKVAMLIDKQINEKRLQQNTISSSPIRRRQSSSRETTPSKSNEKKEPPKILRRIFYCILLNGGIFLTSIICFKYVLLEGINYLLTLLFDQRFLDNWWWINAVLSLLFQGAWVIPLFIISRLVNMFWFQDIADSAYRYSRGRPIWIQSLNKMAADLVFSVIIQTLFLGQAFLLNYIPFGSIISSFHMCLLYALYSFDYKWNNMGWELHKRLAFIELHWPYFLGFGLPLTICTQIIDSLIISGCIFAALFPFCIISSNEATPITNAGNSSLPIFALVVWLSNHLANFMLKTKKKHNKQSTN